MDIGAIGIYICLFLALYFEVFLLISFLERTPAPRTSLKPAHYPSVSILVPCFNEEKMVASTIQSLLALDYPKNKLEIVVIDDGSTDSTRAIAESFTKNPRIKYFYKENGGKYTALNFGIEHSTGEIIGCLDADSFAAPDALLEMMKTFEADPTIMACTPVMKVYKARTMLERMQAVEYTFGIFYKKMFDNLSALNVLPGPFSMYRREIFAKIGIFHHAHNTEDMEIAFRMQAHGLKIANAHTAFVYTTVPKTIRTLIKQRTRWSQGFLQNSRDYSYMYLNPRFGNFGMLILPIGLTAFFAGIYTAGYALYRLISSLVTRALDLFATRIPPQMPTLNPAHLDWFYINTSMLTFLIIFMLCMTLVAILLGARISETRPGIKSYLSYFLFFGLIAPLWLIRAAWGALLARESAWR